MIRLSQMNKLLLLIILLVSLTSLTSCATISSSCPPVKKYDQQSQKSLADELERFPELQYVVKFLSDYFILREQVRTCRGE